MSALLVAAAGLLVSACSSALPSPEGTIRGTFRMSAGVIVPSNGGAIPGRVTATDRGGQTYSAFVPGSGRFELRVPPGFYTVVGRSPRFVSNGAEGACAAGPISIGSRQVVTLDVTCRGM
jgi:hypothetical protein